MAHKFEATVKRQSKSQWNDKDIEYRTVTVKANTAENAKKKAEQSQSQFGYTAKALSVRRIY